MSTDTYTPVNTLVSIDEASRLITNGRTLSLAGTEAALDQLPAGTWVAGTVPYFMVASGGVVVGDDQVFATDLTDLGETSVACYAAGELGDITCNAPDNGFSVAVIPSGSASHSAFAAEAANFDDAFVKPTVGWIAGVHLSDLGTVTPKVYDGRTATKHEDAAVVLYVSLPADNLASVEIVNIFEPGDGDVLEFDETSFTVKSVRVNGEPRDFAHYLRENGHDGGQLPLVGDFAGAHINVSLQSVADDSVVLYAPVFPGVEYRFARPVADYVGDFRSKLGDVDGSGAAWGCNCILNFLFGELEGKAIGGLAGPVTFGQIGYQLLNQTFVQVRVL